MLEISMGTFRGIITAILLGLFVWLVFWAWNKARRADFDTAARIPLDDQETSR